MKPVRIQLKRTKGWRMPPNTVKVCRPGPYGNPFKIGEYDPAGERITTAARAVDLFRQGLMFSSPPGWWEKIRGKNLACWCKPGEPCHADVLLEIANP